MKNVDTGKGFPNLISFYTTGVAECKANFHNVEHYPNQVRINGPLWASMSGFNFENWNGNFKYYFHGTQNIEKQVSFCQ